MSQGNVQARRLREKLGNENYGLQRQAQTDRGNQRFANFLGSLTNIPGFVGLKGIFVIFFLSLIKKEKLFKISIIIFTLSLLFL